MPTFVPTASRFGEVKEYYFATKLREIRNMQQAGQSVLNLGIGSPDLPPPPTVIEELSANVLHPDNHGYQSYQGLPMLRQAFADWYRNWFDVALDAETEILPLMGSKEGIMHISMTFLEKGDEVLVPNPGYPAYTAVANLTGATIRKYALSEENNWLPDLDDLAASDLSRVKIMWLNYPHMPTGTPASRTFFEKVIAFAHQNQILVCNDNPYAFILNDHPISLLSIDGAKEVAMELNSLSKAHNMAGWRVGMLAGKADHLQAVLRFKSNMDSGMFKPLQLAAVRALQSSSAWYDNLNAVYRERRLQVFAIMDALGCTYAKDQTGLFVWAKVPAHYESGFALSDEALYQAGVFITPGGIFGSQGDPYIRISLCSSAAIFAEALEKLQKHQVGVQHKKELNP
ncbi:MAG: aminotransferase class I/II-fold pyridoxal phosphate-dependent enzyme [Saprospiraceae bacterium]|nr:aminotransferase class I/II-fold pyridoxal phosphate-dependent enzyme [Saprospiraceae bacterium]